MVLTKHSTYMKTQKPFLVKKHPITFMQDVSGRHGMKSKERKADTKKNVNTKTPEFSHL